MTTKFKSASFQIISFRDYKVPSCGSIISFLNSPLPPIRYTHFHFIVIVYLWQYYTKNVFFLFLLP